jgi:hypothetical protein
MQETPDKHMGEHDLSNLRLEVDFPCMYQGTYSVYPPPHYGEDESRTGYMCEMTYLECLTWERTG